MSDSYPNTIDTDTFSVKLVQRELGNVNTIYVITDERPLRVVDQSEADRSITVKYGGAYSGTYDVVVTNQDGNIKCDIVFEVIFHLEDFNPKTGSQVGGQLVTITGRHFSDVITDNPVKIGYEYISGTDHYCYVIETSEYEIKCRTAEDWNRVPDTTNVIVFASTSEEALCVEAGGCEYTYVDVSTLATLTSASSSWDESTYTYSIVVSGSGITDTAASDF